MSSFQISVPDSLASWAPMCLLACQLRMAAPVGSMKTAMRPASMTSKGSATTIPPASLTLAAVASMSAVAR